MAKGKMCAPGAAMKGEKMAPKKMAQALAKKDVSKNFKKK